jgi:hypothetical protein
MGRPSKLSESQRAQIEKRLLAGEKAADLAKEFKVHRSAISRGVAQPLQNVQNAAGKVFEAGIVLSELPVAQQGKALNLAATLASISGHLAAASNYGAMTSHRLSGIANGQVDKIDDADPMKSDEALKAIAVLTKIANSSAEIGLNLLRANKEAIDGMNKTASEPPEPKQIVFTVQDARA